jgi:hypothetical protein
MNVCTGLFLLSHLFKTPLTDKAQSCGHFFLSLLSLLSLSLSFLIMDIHARLIQCISLSQQKEKVDAFRTVLESILSSPSSSSFVAHLQDYVNAVLDEQVGLVIARQLLTEFMERFDTRLKDHQVQKQVLSFAIERAQPRVVSFEELVRKRKGLNHVGLTLVSFVVIPIT